MEGQGPVVGAPDWEENGAEERGLGREGLEEGAGGHGVPGGPWKLAGVVFSSALLTPKYPALLLSACCVTGRLPGSFPRAMVESHPAGGLVGSKVGSWGVNFP